MLAGLTSKIFTSWSVNCAVGDDSELIDDFRREVAA